MKTETTYMIVGQGEFTVEGGKRLCFCPVRERQFHENMSMA